ncbi:MAG: aspartate ammonia-lyase, partial [Candidatus Eisenbacteria bacterium]|nr:aspartate ammonia-lyase [Candidatus Eisenbacteria bacterium]
MHGERIERDGLGEVRIPDDVHWGPQTQRAVENFAISGQRMPMALIVAIAHIKRHAAEVNAELGLLDAERARAIAAAAGEVVAGEWDAQFPVDVFQTGSGTSTNMNVNEVVASRANQILGHPRGSREPVHPNDHVNLGQSSNDVIPTAIHLAVRQSAAALCAASDGLRGRLLAKQAELAGVVKLARTHLQDAVPMTLGQEFSGYATQIAKARGRIAATLPDLEELALGATAAGTGLGAHPDFAAAVIARLAAETNLPLRPAENRFEALAARDALVATSAALCGLAGALMKIAEDLRLLSSGPRGGLGEIALPALQPGSSIMPGKVNPVIPEMVIQVAAQVMGHHQAIAIGGQHGPLELNMMMPMIGANALGACGILTAATRALADRCIAGLTADAQRCRALAERSLALATALAPRIGYDRATRIAQRTLQED